MSDPSFGGAQTPTPPHVGPQRPARRVPWPLIAIGAAVLALVIVLIIAMTNRGGSGTPYEPGFPGLPPVVEPDYGDPGYSGSGFGIDPADPMEQETALTALLEVSKIEGLVDLCADFTLGSIDIYGSTPDDPDTITQWSYDGSVYEFGEYDAFDDVRFDPYEFNIADYIDAADTLDAKYTANGNELAMVCVTTEMGDPEPYAAYYFSDPSVESVNATTVYLNLDTLEIVYEQ